MTYHLVRCLLSSVSDSLFPPSLPVTEELKPYPPTLLPHEDPADEADDEKDIYDVVEEVMQSPAKVGVIYGYRAKVNDQFYCQIEEEPPPPPRPPKPASSPSVPRKEVSPASPQPLRAALPPMRGPIQALSSPGMRQPIQTPDTRPAGARVNSPVQTTRTPSPPQTDPTTVSSPPPPHPPPPPPPPPASTNTKVVKIVISLYS